MTALLVANDGGHIQQLRSLHKRLSIGTDHVWVTVPTAQTRSLMAGEQVIWSRPAPTRDLAAAVVNGLDLADVLHPSDFSHVVSTGASLAVSILPVARLRGISTHYIESATRARGPSVSGRILAHVPGIHLYSQHPTWAAGRWQYRGSVFDGYRLSAGPPPEIRRAVVSLGTHRQFGFRRLVERLVRIIPPSVDVLWQTGATEVADLGIVGRASVPSDELRSAIAAAEVVVGHAGVGFALTALGLGKQPVIVPRLARHDEHVDDHQEQVSNFLASSGVALVRDADEVTWQDLRTAASNEVRTESTRPFQLMPD